MISKLHRASSLHRVLLVVGCLFLAIPEAIAQSIDSPQTRLRPIGSPSMVDQYWSPDRAVAVRPDDRSPNLRETSNQVVPGGRLGQADHVRQTAWMQNFDLPPIPSNSQPTFTPPNSGLPSPDAIPLPQSSPVTAAPPISATPNGLRGGAVATPAPANLIPAQDYAPLAQPRLDQSFATLDNSCHVSGPSRYTAANASGCCSPVAYQAPVAYQPPPAFVAPPAPVSPPPMIAPTVVPSPVVPGAVVQGATVPTGAPAGSLISFGQERYPVQVGQGLFGQPVAYVPGQKCRNWLRYIFP